MGLADFQGCYGDCCECRCEQPEAYDYLRFGPACEVEVVVDWCASEDAFSSGVFEIADLQDYADQFDYEYSADD